MSNPNNESLLLNDLLVIAPDADDPWDRVNENFQRIMEWTSLLVARNPRIEYLNFPNGFLSTDQPSTTSGTWATIDLSKNSAPDHAIGAVVRMTPNFAAEQVVYITVREDSSHSSEQLSQLSSTGIHNHIQTFVFFGPGTKKFDVQLFTDSGTGATSNALLVLGWIF